MKSRVSICAFLLFAALAPSAAANCGSASCPIDLHALYDPNFGRWSIDLSLQYIDQDRTRGVAVGPVHHDEMRTINRITSVQFMHALSEGLQLGAVLPYVSRFHEHFDHHESEFQQWQFASRGDASVMARWRLWEASQSPSTLWLTGGVKLPTGARHKSAFGEEAEVTIQPGTGSVDETVGVTWSTRFARNTAASGPMGHATLIPLFASASYRLNGRGTERYRRGNEMQASVGTELPLGNRFSILGQINGRWQSKDDVGDTDENREQTGGSFLYASPGLRVALPHGYSVFAVIQLPLRQEANGIQLVSRHNYLLGLNRRY